MKSASSFRRTTRVPPKPRSPRALLCEWSAGGVSYRLQPARGGALLTAVGPGVRIRTSTLAIDDPGAAEWVSLTDRQRTMRAEQLLAR